MYRLIHINFHHCLNNFNEKNCETVILNHLSKIISFQLETEMCDDPFVRNYYINIDFRTRENVKSIILENLNKSVPDTCPFVTGGVTALGAGISQRHVANIISTDYFKLEGFEGLSTAKVMDIDSQSLENYGRTRPIFDLRRLDNKYIQSVRNDILKRFYNSLDRVYRYFDVERNHLKEAYKAVKKMPWYIEDEIGDIVLSRGASSRKAQLIGRWRGQFVYYIARVYNNDHEFKDIIFNIIWRPRSINQKFGRLVWVNKNTLRFVPSYKESVRMEFQVDGDAIKFPYYEKPWEKIRKTEGNVWLGEKIESVNNIIKLNF